MVQRKYKFILPILCLGFSLYAAPSFDCTAGILGDFQKAETPYAKFSGFAAGQLNIGPSLVLRGEFSARPQEEYVNSKKIEETDTFSLNELSGTFVLPHSFGTSFFSVYRGGFEPIGSGLFLQRLFNTEPYTSSITETWLGSTGATVHDFRATVGGAYTLKLKSLPIAARFYLYRNNDSLTRHYQPNTELRLGIAMRYFKLDMAGGFSAPIYQKDSAGKRVLLMIDDVTVHGGFDMLLGSKNFASLFVEAGIDQLHIDGNGIKLDLTDSGVKTFEDAIDAITKSLFVLVEPRINLQVLTVHAAAFVFPDDVTKDLLFITYDKTTPSLINSTFGTSFGFETQEFKLFKQDTKFGVNISIYKNGLDFDDLKDIKDDATIKFSPYVTCKIAGGELKTMVHINTTKVDDGSKKAIKLTTGYKINL